MKTTEQEMLRPGETAETTTEEHEEQSEEREPELYVPRSPVVPLCLLRCTEDLSGITDNQRNS